MTDVTPEQADILIKAALANYTEDVGYPPSVRSLLPSEFRDLHDTLVALGEIDSEVDAVEWGKDDDYVLLEEDEEIEDDDYSIFGDGPEYDDEPEYEPGY